MDWVIINMRHAWNLQICTVFETKRKLNFTAFCRPFFSFQFSSTLRRKVVQLYLPTHLQHLMGCLNWLHLALKRQTEMIFTDCCCLLTTSPLRPAVPQWFFRTTLTNVPYWKAVWGTRKTSGYPKRSCSEVFCSNTNTYLVLTCWELL